MWLKIKNNLRKGWEWTKKKVRRFKRWLIALVIPVAMAAPALPMDMQYEYMVERYESDTSTTTVYFVGFRDPLTGEVFEVASTRKDWNKAIEKGSKIRPKKKDYVSALELLRAKPVEAAITQEDVNTNNSSSPGLSFTFDLTVPAGEDNAIAVITNLHDATGGDREVSYIRYNSVDLDQAVEVDDSGNFIHTEIWTMPEPSEGTNSLLVSFVGQTEYNVTAYVLSGVDQDQVVAATNSVTDSSSGDKVLSVAASSTLDWVIDGFIADSETHTAGSWQNVYNSYSFTSGNEMGYHSTSTATTTSGYIHKWNSVSTDQYANVIASIKENEAPPTPDNLTFLQATEDLTDTGAYTFSSQNLGAADTDRSIIVTVNSRNAGAAANILSLTVAGETATKVVQETHTITNSDIAGIFIVDVPTGTSGDIVVTFSGTMTKCEIGVYRAIGVATSTGYATSTSIAEDPTTTLDIPAGGFAIGTANTNANTVTAWTGLTEDSDGEMETFLTYSDASDEFALAKTGRTITADFTSPGSEGVGVFASWGISESGPAAVPAYIYLDGGSQSLDGGSFIIRN